MLFLEIYKSVVHCIEYFLLYDVLTIEYMLLRLTIWFVIHHMINDISYPVPSMAACMYQWNISHISLSASDLDTADRPVPTRIWTHNCLDYGYNFNKSQFAKGLFDTA